MCLFSKLQLPNKLSWVGFGEGLLDKMNLKLPQPASRDEAGALMNLVKYINSCLEEVYSHRIIFLKIVNENDAQFFKLRLGALIINKIK